jgi:hypothetical protein
MNTQQPAAGAFTRGVRAWDRFWFTPADPTTLGLIRIFCGLIVLYVHLAYTYDLQEFFGAQAWLNLPAADVFRHEAPWVAPPLDWAGTPVLPPPAEGGEQARVMEYVQRWGVDPRLTLAQGSRSWSVWYHVTDPTAMCVLHLGVLVVMVLFTVGFCTRLMAVLTWLAALSYIHRSVTTLFGMDAMMAILLLYLMIGPSGAALSLDRLLERRRARRAAGKGSAEKGPDASGGGSDSFSVARPQPLVSANVVLRLMQVHFCIIYMAAGLSKLLGGAWWNGTALWWTLANPEFTPLRFPAYAEGLRWLCRHRWLWELVMTGGVVYTLALEIGFPFLVWNPRRRGLMVIGAVLLHTGIALTMGLVGFGLLMLALVLSFVPAEAVHEVLDRQAQGEPASGSQGPGTTRPEARAA